MKEAPFSIRGVVEGFYGVYYTFPERNDLIRFLGRHGFNLYIYGPKNDRQHRARWWDPYPPDIIAQFAHTVRVARRAGVDFCYAISFGVPANYASQDDFDTIRAKLRAFFNIGVRSFSLFLDDTACGFQHEVNARKFRTYADAHVDMCNRLHDWLRSLDSSCTLALCQTEYRGVAPFSAYLHDLGRDLCPEIDLFYSGPKICAPAITTAQVRDFTAVARRSPIIWDNYAANDLDMKGEMHIGPLRRRDPSLHEVVKGVVVNPMNVPEASKIPLLTYAYPRLVSYAVSGFFQYVEERFGASLPTVKGDGGAYWEDGALSSIVPTTLVRGAQAALPAAETLEALAVIHTPDWAYPLAQFDQARRQLLLSDEHTWGAFLNCRDPEALLQQDQWAVKEGLLRDAAAWAQRLLHGGATRHSLSWNTGGRDVVVYNTHNWICSGPVTVEIALTERLYDAATGAALPIRTLRATTTQALVELWVDHLLGLSYRRVVLREADATTEVALPSEEGTVAETVDSPESVGGRPWSNPSRPGGALPLTGPDTNERMGQGAHVPRPALSSDAPPSLLLENGSYRVTIDIDVVAWGLSTVRVVMEDGQ